MKNNFLSNLKKFYSRLNASKFDKYQNIINKINDFKIAEKNLKPKRQINNSVSLITSFQNSKQFKNLVKKISKFNNKIKVSKANKFAENFLTFKNSLKVGDFIAQFNDRVNSYKLFNRSKDNNPVKKNDKYNQKIGIIF